MALFSRKPKVDTNLIIADIQISVAFTSFFTAVTIFFVGLLITQYENFNSSVSIPILFLIISTFGFLYSTLIFANTSGKIIYLKKKDVKLDINLANSLSEYLGVYLLVLAIPLVINVMTVDNFLRIATMVAALGGLLIYHLAGFSIMERAFKKTHHLFLLLIIFLEVLIYCFQLINIFCFSLAAVALILLLAAITFIARE